MIIPTLVGPPQRPTGGFCRCKTHSTDYLRRSIRVATGPMTNAAGASFMLKLNA